MEMALICSEELLHSTVVEKISLFFDNDPLASLTVLARTNLDHCSLKNYDLFFVLGGDGTLFTLTHYLQKGYIVGIHAGNDRSVGHFMGISLAQERLSGQGCLQEKMKLLGEKAIEEREAGATASPTFTKYNRLKACIHKATGTSLPVDLAFNEYAIGNNLFGRPSKYLLSLERDDTAGPVHPSSRGEWQRSSGVIVSTYHGMSGWVRHLLCGDYVQKENGSKISKDGSHYVDIRRDYLNKGHMDNSEFFYIVREPMHDVTKLSGFTRKLTLTSDMAGGIISLDGFNEYPFERNDRIVIEMSQRPLQLFSKKKIP